MKDTMSKLVDKKYRGIVLLLFVLVTTSLAYLTYMAQNEIFVKYFLYGDVKTSLEDTLQGVVDDAERLGSSSAIEWPIVTLLQRTYNQENAHVFITALGKSTIKEIPKHIVNNKQHELTLNFTKLKMNAKVILTLPDLKWHVIAVTIITLLSGILLLIFHPPYHPLDQYPLAKIYGVIFDRKVSSKKPWGSWQLTHLGTGSGLVNISPNNYEQANNEESVNKCFEGIRSAVKSVGDAFSRDIDLLKEWPANRIVLNDMLLQMETSMKGRPAVRVEKDVVSFISYIRNTVLKPVMTNVADVSTYTDILKLNPSEVKSCPPSGWLIDGYNVFMPRTLWNKLLISLNDGLHMAYNTRISGVKVYSNDSTPFIFIDFAVRDRTLDADNLKRLKEYLKCPYPGDLNDLVSGISTFGRLLILDNKVTIDLTDNKVIKKGSVDTLTIRFMMRRIDKDERNLLIEKMDNALAHTW